jgi:O-antigen/teichoic acid export membrane protein
MRCDPDGRRLVATGALSAGDAAPSTHPRPAGLQVGVVANLVGRAWPTLLGLFAIPLYIEWLGNEAYGLVGSFVVLQAVSAVLDMGLGATLTRQLARASAGSSTAQESRDLVRSLEFPYWAATALIAAASLVVAAPLATGWLKFETLPAETVRRAAVLMGVTAAAQLPFTLYSAGLLGLGRQILLNSVTVTIATIRIAGTVLVLKYVSTTIEAFFVCQLVASALQTAAGAVALWTSLPQAGRRARFDRGLLASNLRFAAGVAAITVVSIVLTQADKVVLTNILPLGEYAFYSIASQVAGALLMVAMPVFTSAFPRLSAIAARGDGAAESREYHRAGQVVAALALPCAVTLAAFSHDVLFGWTGKADVADNAALPTTLLVVGTAMNALMHVPYALMLAHGWTRLPLAMNSVAIVVLVPLVYWASVNHGLVGAAAVWIALNGAYVTIAVHLLHRRLLRGEKARWYLHDVGLPLVGALAGAALAHVVLPHAVGRPWLLARVAAVGATSLVGAALAASEIRALALGRFRGR